MATGQTKPEQVRLSLEEIRPIPTRWEESVRELDRNWEFIIPKNPDDLLRSHEDDALYDTPRYLVKLMLPIDVVEKYEVCRFDLEFSVPNFTFVYFDQLYGALTFMEHMDVGHAFLYSEIALKTMQLMVPELKCLLTKTLSNETRRDYRNKVKMNVYLLAQFIEKMELKYSTTGITEAQEADWTDYKIRALAYLHEMLQLPIHHLWKALHVESAVSELLIGICCVVMQNPSYNLWEEMQQETASVLTSLIQSATSGLKCTKKLLLMVQDNPFLVGALAEFVGSLERDPFCKGTANRMITCLTEFTFSGKGNLKVDVFGGFLLEIVKNSPRSFLANFDALRPLLFGQHQQNHWLQRIICELLVSTMQGPALEEREKDKRSEFLNLLMTDAKTSNSATQFEAIHHVCRLVQHMKLTPDFILKAFELSANLLEQRSNNAAQRSGLDLVSTLMSHHIVQTIPFREVADNLQRCQKELKDSQESAPRIRPWPEIMNEVYPLLDQWKVRENEETVDLCFVTSKTLPGAVTRLADILLKGMWKPVVRLAKRILDYHPSQDDISLWLLRPLHKVKEEPEEFMPLHLVGVQEKNLLELLKHVGDCASANMREKQGASGDHPDRGDEPHEEGIRSELMNPPTREMYLQERGTHNRLHLNIQYLSDLTLIKEALSRTVPELISLLRSQQDDQFTHRMIQLIMTYMQMGLDEALPAVRKMLALYRSQEHPTHHYILKQFAEFCEGLGPEDSKRRTIMIITQLARIVDNCSNSELQAMELLICYLVQIEYLDRWSFQLMWEIVTGVSKYPLENKGLLLMLLGMASKYDQVLSIEDIEEVMRIGLSEESDPYLLRYTCTLISNLDREPGTWGQKPKLPKDHKLFRFLHETVLEYFFKHPLKSLLGLGSGLVDVIFAKSEDPVAMMESILWQVVSNLSIKNKNPTHKAVIHEHSKFIHLVSLFTMGHLQHLRVRISREKEKKVDQRIKRERVEAHQLKHSRGHSRGTPTVKNKVDVDPEEDSFYFIVFFKSGHELVLRQAMECYFSAFVNGMCTYAQVYSTKEVWSSAQQVLHKLMHVSRKCCREFRELLFKLLVSTPFAEVCLDTLETVKDMTYTHPDVVNPLLPDLYTCLGCQNVKVRRKVLRTICELILACKLTASGKFVRLTLCLVDPDQEIVRNAQMLFVELAKRPKMGLTKMRDEAIEFLTRAGITQEHFCTVMMFLLRLKDPSGDVVESVCQLCRHMSTKLDMQARRNLAFCISELSYTEANLTPAFYRLSNSKISEWLHDPDVHSHIFSIPDKFEGSVKNRAQILVDQLVDNSLLYMAPEDAMKWRDTMALLEPPAETVGNEKTPPDTAKPQRVVRFDPHL